MTPPRKVLLVAEGTTLSRESLMCAVNLCQRTSASLLVLNAVPCPREHTYWVEVQRRLERERLEEAARNIDPLVEQARSAGVEAEVVRRAGDTDALLTALAKSEGSMLAVIAGQPAAPQRAAAACFDAEAAARQLFQRIQDLFGCPFVAVKAKR